MTIFTEILSGIWGIVKSAFDMIVELAPRVISFCLWVLSGIIVLPCVFIAGTLYPKWVEWGEKNF